jgi:hypothetical protein
MRNLLLAGDRGAAERYLEALTQRVRNELDVAPEAATRALLNAGATLPVEGPPPTRYVRDGGVHLAFRTYGAGRMALITGPTRAISNPSWPASSNLLAVLRPASAPQMQVEYYPSHSLRFLSAFSCVTRPPHPVMFRHGVSLRLLSAVPGTSKTAKAPGLRVPPSLLARADELSDSPQAVLLRASPTGRPRLASGNRVTFSAGQGCTRSWRACVCKRVTPS